LEEHVCGGGGTGDGKDLLVGTIGSSPSEAALVEWKELLEGSGM